MEALLAPPIAFMIYLGFAALINWLGRAMAGPGETTLLKQSTYSSGEEAPTSLASPGYRPFFVIALFFAILHLGILVVGSGGFSVITAVYLVGLMLALVALILG
jgi:hypothetical protein